MAGFQISSYVPCPAELQYLPASSKRPFDTPNGGHLTLEKVTSNSQMGHWEKPGTGFLHAWTGFYRGVSHQLYVISKILEMMFDVHLMFQMDGSENRLYSLDPSKVNMKG